MFSLQVAAHHQKKPRIHSSTLKKSTFCPIDVVLCLTERFRFNGFPFINCWSLCVCYWCSNQEVVFCSNAFKDITHSLLTGSVDLDLWWGLCYAWIYVLCRVIDIDYFALFYMYNPVIPVQFAKIIAFLLPLCDFGFFVKDLKRETLPTISILGSIQLPWLWTPTISLGMVPPPVGWDLLTNLKQRKYPTHLSMGRYDNDNSSTGVSPYRCLKFTTKIEHHVYHGKKSISKQNHLIERKWVETRNTKIPCEHLFP